MAQVLTSIIFTSLAFGGFVLIAAMLRSQWARIVAILTGAELALARNSAPQVRVRQRAWSRPEPRPVPHRRAAAA